MSTAIISKTFSSMRQISVRIEYRDSSKRLSMPSKSSDHLAAQVINAQAQGVEAPVDVIDERSRPLPLPGVKSPRSSVALVGVILRNLFASQLAPEGFHGAVYEVESENASRDDDRRRRPQLAVHFMPC
jgi:hypothetical protein